MKTRILFVTAAAISTFGLNSARAADYTPATSNPKAHTGSQHPQKISEQDLRKKVTKVNKASSFVGMNVKNLQNDNLGKVEDLVFDPESGKISYAVLSIGGFLGVNEKYIAVPLNALTPAPGEDHLILDADKQRLDRAPGFAKNKWPDLDTPAWSPSAGYSRTPVRPADARAAGTVGRAAQEQGVGTVTSEHQERFSGTLSQLDATGKTMTVKDDRGEEKTFHLDQSPTITAGALPDAKLEDLKVGSKVTVHYQKEGDKSEAKSIKSGESDADHKK